MTFYITTFAEIFCEFPARNNMGLGQKEAASLCQRRGKRAGGDAQFCVCTGSSGEKPEN